MRFVDKRHGASYTVTQLPRVVAESGDIFTPPGYYRRGDGGMGYTYVYDEGSTLPVDFGFVLPGRNGSFARNDDGSPKGSPGRGRYLALNKEVAYAKRWGVPTESGLASSAIQWMLDSVRGRTKTIVFENGLYRLGDTPIVLTSKHSGLKIRGQSNTGTIFEGRAIKGGFFNLNTDQKAQQIKDVELSDFRLRGSATPRAATYGITLNNAARCNVNRIHFQCHVSDSSLFIRSSWDCQFQPLAFPGIADVAHIRVLRDAESQSSNTLNFYSPHTSNAKTPYGFLIDIDGTTADVGDNINVWGGTFQNKVHGYWNKKGRACGLNGVYFEGAAKAAIRLGDSSVSTRFAKVPRIDNCSFNRQKRAIWLDQCTIPSMTPQLFENTEDEIVVDECYGGVYHGPKEHVKRGQNARKFSGLMVLDIDRPDGPPFNPSPGDEQAGGIVIPGAATGNKHVRVSVDALGNRITETWTPSTANVEAPDP